MPIPPEMDMGRKEADSHAKLHHALHLVLAQHLSMDDRVAVILAGVRLLRRFDRVDEIVAACVPVTVAMYLKPQPMQFRDLCKQLITGGIGHAAGRIGMDRFVIGRTEKGGL